MYEACMETSPTLTPPVVDAMELWEVAAVLGRARGVVVATNGSNMAEARRRAAREGRPPPEFPQRSQPLHPLIGTVIPTNLPR